MNRAWSSAGLGVSLKGSTAWHRLSAEGSRRCNPCNRSLASFFICSRVRRCGDVAHINHLPHQDDYHGMLPSDVTVITGDVAVWATSLLARMPATLLCVRNKVDRLTQPW